MFVIPAALFGHGTFVFMRYLPHLAMALTLISFAFPAKAQDRFKSGPEKGFLRSPTEHIIVELPEPLTVRNVEGSVKDPHNDDMANVAFEIRDESGSIRTAFTDSRGRFLIRSVIEGTYRFKATKNGFQSIVGTIIIAKSAPKKTAITLHMNLGV